MFYNMSIKTGIDINNDEMIIKGITWKHDNKSIMMVSLNDSTQIRTYQVVIIIWKNVNILII